MASSDPTPGFPFVVCSLRDAYDPCLIRRFHEFVGAFFPIPDEMDPCEEWLENLRPDASAPVPMFALAVFDPTDSEEPPPGRLVAGALFEYYRLSNAALLSYVCVLPSHQRRGIAQQLIHLMLQRLAQEALASAATAPTEPTEDARLAAVRRVARVPTAAFPPRVWADAAACLSPEDVAWAAAPGDLGPTLPVVVFAETNALGVEDGVMDAAVRHAALHRLGFRLLDFGFVQPPLGEGLEPCHDLLLLAHRSLQAAAHKDAPALPRWRLLLFLYDYALSVHRAPSFRTAPYWTHMAASLADPALPLRTLPWTRQPAAVLQHR